MFSEISPSFEKEKRFRDFQIWPLAATLDVKSWLENFEADHQSFALKLLDGFTYLADPIINAMLLGAVQRLVDLDFSTPPAKSDSFFDRTLFVIVQGENPSVSDSGHIFARKLRDKIGVAEWKITDPARALSLADKFENIVFIDDFIGSGQQMLHTWFRPHDFSGGTTTSFKQLSSGGKHSFFYCATVCSYKGREILSSLLPELRICAAHMLRPSDCLADVNHQIWKGDAANCVDLLREYSRKAGYDAEDGNEEDWRGFYGQGLGLAFSHGVPDATLPVFRSTKGTWQPLVRIKA